MLLIGIFCGVVFATRCTSFVFAYDIASWLFLILTSSFLVKGLNANKLLYLYSAGILLAFACLFRLPDIVFIGLLPMILVYYHAWNIHRFTFTHFWTLVKQYCSFIAGTVSLFIFVAGIFKYLNIDDIFLRNLVPDSGHSAFYVLKFYLNDIIDFLPHLLSVTSLFLSISLIYEYSRHKKKISPFYTVRHFVIHCCIYYL